MELPGVGGRIRQEPEDFVVDEIPAYEPCGEGEHVFVRLRKRGLTTDDAMRAISRQVGCSPRNIGCAGRKDKRAVTSQWLSFPSESEARLKELDLPGVEVLEVSRHTNKLRTGHLHGNRFTILIRGVEDGAVERAEAVVEHVARQGMPNAFGPQRFGRRGDNVEVALEWIRGKAARPPRGKREGRLLVSSLQAGLFNQVVEARLELGGLSKVLSGDVVKRHDSGGMFVAEDLAEVNERSASGLVSATGPMFGTKMWWPEGEALELEKSILAASELDVDDLARFKAYGKGTRRLLRIFPGALTVEPVDEGLKLSFELESGAFATTLLAAVMGVDEVS